MTENTTNDHGAEQEPQVVRIILQLSNGTIDYVEGKDAQDYINEINAALFIDQIHGGSDKPFAFIHALISELPQIIARQIDLASDEEEADTM